MKKIKGLSLLIFFCSVGYLSHAQYYFSDTITFNLTLTAGRVDTMRSNMRAQGLSESTIDGIISNFAKSYSNMRSIQSRTVTLEGDSCFVELNYNSSKAETFVMPGNKIVMVKGNLYRQDSKSKELVYSNIDDSSRMFKATGQKRTVMGYECWEYISLDGVYVVWVNKDLPSTLNPGISHINIPGAILGYETRMGNAITRSQLIKIQL